MIAAHDTKKEIAKAVVIAGLSALATRLVEWGVESIKKRGSGRWMTW